MKVRAADPRHFEKFQVYFDELDKVTQLLLMLSSRLSRLDNSISQLATSGNEREIVS
jgi:Apx/Shroom domain ASD2